MGIDAAAWAVLAAKSDVNSEKSQVVTDFRPPSTSTEEYDLGLKSLI